LPETLLAALGVAVAAVVIRAVVVILIKRWVKRAGHRAEARRGAVAIAKAGEVLQLTHGQERRRQRTAALASLLRSMTTFLVVTVALATIVAMFGVPLAPLLAATGVGGVALGFGAQSLIKDFLAGIAIIMEDQYGVGDFISTQDVSGEVEEIGLRVTRLRDTSGQVWYVRNGEINKVGNLSQGWSTALVQVPISPHADAAKAIAVLEDVVAGLAAEPEFADALIEPPSVSGVSGVSGTQQNIQIIAKTAPNQHFGIQRELLARSVAALREAGVEGPIPGIGATIKPA
jgi:small conductance mechanosensitive channel